MSKLKTVPINGEKLRTIIMTSGLSLQEASLKLGFSKGYLTDACRENRLTIQSMSLIGLVLNIPQALYEVRDDPDPDPEEEAEPESTEDILRMILKELKEIKKIVKGEDYEQKTWALPFSADSDRCGCDIPVDSVK